MTNSAPVQPFNDALSADGGDAAACAGEGRPGVEPDAEGTPCDVTIVPAHGRGSGSAAAPPRRPSGVWTAALLSLALHGGVVAAGAWAVAAGWIPFPLPTLGTRGDGAEGGLSADPGASALAGVALPPAGAAHSVAVEPIALEATPDDAPAAAEAFADVVAAPPRPAEPMPLIGLGEILIPPPTRRHPAAPDSTPQTDSIQQTDSTQPTDSTSHTDARAAAVAAGAARASVKTEVTASADSDTPAGGNAPLDAQAGAYTPPRAAGRGAGLSGRRGARGLDRRGLPIPDYPREARRRGEQGTVVLDVSVRADGRVGDVRVVTSSTYPLLDRAASFALRHAEFTPALLGGRPVEGTIRVPYRFRLD